jgi:hypothetical protein
MTIEKQIIKLIESLDKISDTWCKLTLRRTITSIFTLIVWSQIIITTILWIFGKEISSTWVEFIGIEFVAWGTVLSFYFYERRKNGGKDE